MKFYEVHFWVLDNEETYPFDDWLLIEANSLEDARLTALLRIRNEFGVKPQFVEQMNFFKADTDIKLAVYSDEWLMLHKD